MKKKKYRNAVFIVTYARVHSVPSHSSLTSQMKQKNKIYYLILRRKLHWKGWEFPKGGLKKFETKKRAIKREIKEETGLRILNIKKFNVSGKYKYDKIYPDRSGITGQTFSLYAVKVNKTKVRIDKIEHSGYKWLEFKEAIKKLTWPNQKKCLKIVDEWLEKS